MLSHPYLLPSSGIPENTNALDWADLNPTWNIDTPIDEYLAILQDTFYDSADERQDDGPAHLGGLSAHYEIALGGLGTVGPTSQGDSELLDAEPIEDVILQWGKFSLF